MVLFILFGLATPGAFADAGSDSSSLPKHNSSDFVSGETSGTAALQRKAIEDVRHQLVKTDKADDPAGWAKSQHELGVTLRIMQEQSVNANQHNNLRLLNASPEPTSQICAFCQLLLRESISAFRAALEVRTNKNATTNWAETQFEMGRTLLAIGDLESDIERMKEAATAFYEALRVYSRQKDPELWGAVQLYLGETTQRLGVRMSGDAGREQLKKSIDAYQEALKVFTPKSEYWPAIQNNLCGALTALYERDGNKKHLQKAVAAMRAGLEATNRDIKPLLWASAQNNLGNALQTLGRLENNKAFLNESVNAYRAALTSITRESDSGFWVGTQGSLAFTLRVLGALESGAASSERLNESVSAYRALVEFTEHEQMMMQHALTLMDMSDALFVWGRNEKNIARLEEAIDANLKGINMLAGELPQVLETLGEKLGTDRFANGIPPMLWARYLIDFADRLYSSAEILGSGTRWLDEAAILYKRVWNLYSQPGSGASRQDVISVEIKHENVEKLMKKRQAAR